MNNDDSVIIQIDLTDFQGERRPVLGKYSGETMAYLFDDSEITETISPYIMARIVDVREFLADYPYQVQPEELKLHFLVHDAMAPWNEGDSSNK